MCFWKQSALTFVVLASAITQGARADVLDTTDGRTFDGTLVSKTPEEIIFEVQRFGAKAKMRFDPKIVASIREGVSSAPAAAVPATTKPAPAPAANAAPTPPPVVKHKDPVYYRIPLRGEVGSTFVANILEKSLADAVTRSPTAVILEVDSPGGQVGEVDKLIGAIAKYKKQLRIIVVIRRAISAAAITALTADEIYMHEAATFGGATAYRLTASGMPENIGEKMQSIWRARGRSAAEIGGHSPLLAEAMIDGSTAIYLQETGGRKVMSTTREPGAVLFKPSGRLLTMTAQESVQCGISRGIVHDLAELGTSVGHPRWTECEGVGVALTDWWEKRLETGKQEWAASLGRLRAAVGQAVANDPGQFNDYNGGRAADVVRKWNTRANLCVESLRRADVELAKLQKLTTEYEHLVREKPELEASRESLLRVRQSIEAGKLRMPG